jgi:putative ABC transport system substrate-binding protein
MARSATVAGQAQAAARALRRQIQILYASTQADIDRAFATHVRQGARALLPGIDPLFGARRVQLPALAARYAIPTIYPFPPYTPSGGLMSYATSVADAYRDAGAYVGSILQGEKPADLPVQLETKIELVINLKTAKDSRPAGLIERRSVQSLFDGFHWARWFARRSSSSVDNSSTLDTVGCT